MPYFIVRRPSRGLPEPDRTPDPTPYQMPYQTPYQSRTAVTAMLRHLRSTDRASDWIAIEAASAIEASVRAWSSDGSLPPLTLEPVARWAEMSEALDIRYRVFVIEQGVPETEEIDTYDLPRAWARSTVQLTGRLGPRLRLPVATGRLLIDVEAGELPHAGRVAVLPEFRRHGYGARLMRALEAEAWRRGFPGVTLSAQLHAIPFYAALGYRAGGPVFLDAGIEHREMEQRWD